MTAPVFEMKDLCYKHHSNLPLVMDHVNMKIEKGSRPTILGANGAGKTTLFYSLAGVYKPVEGEVLFNGKPIDYTKEGLAEVRSKLAVVLQNPDEQMFSSTVEEDVAFGPLNLDLPKDEVDRRVEEALEEVRMTEYRRSPLQQLSGGQRKRIAIAGAIAVHPDVMIMDEPTAGLDPQASMEAMELAEKMYLKGVTVMISTHDVDMAYAWSDDAKVLRGGGLIFSGSAEEFYSDLPNVLLSGLLTPSTFAMNEEVSRLNGIDVSPYPHNVSQYLAKFRTSGVSSGRLFCVPESGIGDGEGIRIAAKDAGQDARVGVYGACARRKIGDLNEKADFYFDGVDSCLTDCVLGKDSILVYDDIYATTIKENIAVLSGMGVEIGTEGLK